MIARQNANACIVEIADLGLRRLLTLLVFGAVVWCPASSRLEAANSAVTPNPETVLNSFREPIVLKSADMYQDGGTRVIQLVDASSQTLTFCLDGRLKPWKPGEAPQPAKLFFGSHPSSPGAQAIPVGGTAEQHILKLLENWKAGGGPMASLTGASASFPVGQVFEWQRKHVDLVIQALQQRKSESQSQTKK